MQTSNKQYIALYGSLMKSMGGLEKLCIRNELMFIDHCEIKGALYDLGHYPGLVLEDGIVKGELYRILDLSILNRLDRFERSNPDKPEKSLYIRTSVTLIRPEQQAWVYVYNQRLKAVQRIESGDWYSFIKTPGRSNY